MFGLRASPEGAEGGAPVQSRRQKAVRLIMAILIAPIFALTGAGCAQKQSPDVVMIKPHHLSPENGSRHERTYAEVELEDDGREAQQPPLAARKPVADDPNEPYSPNYGRVSSWDDEDSVQTADQRDVQHLTPIHTNRSVPFQQSMLR